MQNAESNLVLTVGLGRGFSGKSTQLSELVWRAQNQGRDIIVADGDLRSRTLATLFPKEAIVPESEELSDIKTWLSKVLNEMVRTQRSAVLDLGSNDRVLLEYGRDLQLVQFCEARGVKPLAIYLLGPEREDMQHILAIWNAKHFVPERTILVLNEGVIRHGQTTKNAFNNTLNNPGFKPMVDAGAKPILLLRLACMETVKQSGVGFYNAAIDGILDPVEQFMTQSWLEDLEGKRAKAGVAAWLP